MLHMPYWEYKRIWAIFETPCKGLYRNHIELIMKRLLGCM